MELITVLLISIVSIALYQAGLSGYAYLRRKKQAQKRSDSEYTAVSVSVHKSVKERLQQATRALEEQYRELYDTKRRISASAFIRSALARTLEEYDAWCRVHNRLSSEGFDNETLKQEAQKFVTGFIDGETEYNKQLNEMKQPHNDITKDSYAGRAKTDVTRYPGVSSQKVENGRSSA